MIKNKDTLLVHSGRDPEANHGIVNPPIYHASTVVFDSVAELKAATAQPFEGTYYGRFGTPTTFAFEEAVAALDGGYERSVATSSGLAAITIALLSFLEQGDHLLMVDSVYGPTRNFCDSRLKSLGIETTYYDPQLADDVAELIRPNTKVVFCESPGSLTFEVQDIPAISKAARAVGAVVMLDNTWATPLFFDAFSKGVDVCVHAATKYIVGHADSMLGVVTMQTAEQFNKVKRTAVLLGNCPGPEACWLGLRGLRSLSARLARHQQSALQLATWCGDQNEVSEVWYPALPGSRGHDLWRRDFSGATGLLALQLNNFSEQAVASMLDNLKLFALGYSWGGYESLALPANGGIHRTKTRTPNAPIIRLHIGLENVADLQRDLARSFERLHAV